MGSILKVEILDSMQWLSLVDAEHSVVFEMDNLPFLEGLDSLRDANLSDLSRNVKA